MHRGDYTLQDIILDSPLVEVGTDPEYLLCLSNQFGRPSRPSSRICRRYPILRTLLQSSNALSFFESFSCLLPDWVMFDAAERAVVEISPTISGYAMRVRSVDRPFIERRPLA